MEKKHRKTIIFGIIVVFVVVIVFKFFPYSMNSHQNGQLKNQETKIQSDKTSLNDQDVPSLINPSENTMETRIKTPLGYERKEDDEGSFVTFLRTYPVKEDGSPILLYNGRKKFSQNNHVAVWKLPLEEEDLQQCADSVMRIYAEYFWETKQYDRISFQFVDGFQAEYKKWREGYRIEVEEDKSFWTKSADYDESYKAFQKYLRMVFAYSSTLSMKEESETINIPDIQAGDIFLKAGSPGHVVMVTDICENENGKKAFLLGQGYMPAQEFHILKNPAHEDDPWYYEDEIEYPFVTPEYTFQENSLRRLNY